jgi:prolipoprotein diacylglyceryltransferase
MPLASIPSLGHTAWRLGPLTLRAYALCVTAGIVVAVVVASRRYRANGGRPGVMLDVAAWAVPFGLAGAAVHALLIDTRHDFGRHDHLWHAATGATAVIGVPGAVALGAAGAWIACRRAGVPLGPVAGAAAPAVMFGLGLAGLGNWWTQQFYGHPSTWWWAVQISPTHRAPGYENYSTFQPAFAYQSLWDVAVGFGVIWAARRFALTGERTFMLCAAAYAAGSFWVEAMRVGPLPQVLGVRSGQAGDVAVFALAVAGLYLARPRRTPPGRTYAKASPPTLVDDSSGDVMSR